MKVLRFIIPLLVLVMIFSISCASKDLAVREKAEPVKEEKIGEESIKEEVTVTEEATEESKEELEVDMDKVKFWEAIIEGEKSYDIADKVLDYSSEEIEILTDFINGEIKYDEQITRFWKLANRIQDDFFLVEMMIGGGLKERGIEEPDEEMQEIINLIAEWADKTEKTYSYYAKYLETDQAEYDFKVDELKEETGDIFTRYLELTGPYARQYNLYYDIK
ncbi:MAG: hypothetical protein PHG41_05570 [Actinomycetota bacterium]|nr:hypothetical protein [Actinomycetota bacterium]